MQKEAGENAYPHAIIGCLVVVKPGHALPTELKSGTRGIDCLERCDAETLPSRRGN